jgi:predicted transcriptional regulator
MPVRGGLPWVADSGAVEEMADKTALTEAEMDVLKALWDRGPATVRAIKRDLETRGRRWAYSTVATLIQRLASKGFVATDSSAVPHIYSPSVSREQLLGRRLRDAADQLCDGNPAPLFLALVQGDYFSPEELERFRRLLEDAARKDQSAMPQNRPSPRGRKT